MNFILQLLLFAPFYMFFGYMYLVISKWEKILSGWIARPDHRREIKDLTAVVEKQIVPMFERKITDMSDAVARYFYG